MVDLGLFDTLVPLASILTIASLVGFILPRNELFGLFLLLWWTISVYISVSGGLFESSSQWSHHDGNGMLLAIGLPAMVLTRLYTWFHTNPKLRRFFYKDLPLWMLFALNAYRLDGLSIVLPLSRGEIPKYLGFQMIVLDVMIGGSALVLAYLVRSKGVQSLATGWKRDFVWFWNSLGLYDLASAYFVLVLNYFQIGGSFLTEPSMAIVGVHPIPLIVLFQAPLAIAIHLYLLTCMEQIVEEQSGSLPLRIQRIRQQR